MNHSDETGSGAALVFRQLYDPATSTYTYLLADEQTREAILIDPVAEQVERDAALLVELDLKLTTILETHAHADHVTGAGALRRRFGAETAVSRDAGVTCADRQLDEADRVEFGAHALRVLETPGHTPGCATYVLDRGDAPMAFTGDALLIRGCGRTDFQSGDAHALFHSVRDKLFALPDTTRVFPGHDYKGRTSSTIGEEKRFNERLRLDVTEGEFVALMSRLGLPAPRLIDVAVPANLACGGAA